MPLRCSRLGSCGSCILRAVPGLERRNQLRRAVCGGVVVGFLAALLFGALQVVFASVVQSGVSRASGSLLGLSLAAGAVAGVVQGAVLTVTQPMIDSLCARHTQAPRWAAVVYTATLTPVLAWFCAGTFSGTARLTAVAAGLGLLAGAFVLLLTVTHAAARLEHLARRGAGQGGWALGAALLLIGLAAGAYAAGQGTELRIRVGLELVAFGLLELAILAVSLGAHAGERRWGRMAAPRGAIAFALVAITAGAFGLSRARQVAPATMAPCEVSALSCELARALE